MREVGGVGCSGDSDVVMRRGVWYKRVGSESDGDGGGDGDVRGHQVA